MASRRDTLLASAEKLLVRGRYDAALKEYLRILTENPNDILVLNKVGDLYVQLNRPSESIPYFTRIAQYYATDGFFLKAIAIYKKINKIEPARLDVYEQLADLYLKQGLLHDARAQFQTLTDHYIKQNQSAKAIEVYRKMSAADSDDIRTPVKLADLLTAVGQTDEALMQYGVVGSMLAKRGAVDEAVAVYQKALKLRPGDQTILRSLVRSMIENGNAEAAIRLLQKEPRTAQTMTMLAEALAAAGRTEEAESAAEGAVALDGQCEPARQMLSSLLLRRGRTRRAFEVLAPLIETAARSGEVKRAISWILPLSQEPSAAPEALDKLAELYQLSGDTARTIETLAALAHGAQQRGDAAAASGYYQRILAIDPQNAQARLALGTPPSTAAAPPRVASPAPPAVAEKPAPPPPEEEFLVEFDDTKLEEGPPVHAPAPKTDSKGLDWEEFSESGETGRTAPVTPVPPPPLPSLPPRPTPAPVDMEWTNAVMEAEVFAKYGLLEKAADKFRVLCRKRADDAALRERYLDILAEMKSPVLLEEAGKLANIYRQAGRTADAERLENRFLARQAPEIPPPPAPAISPASLDFEDFLGITLPASPPPAPVPREPAPAPAPEPALPREAMPSAEIDGNALFSDEQKFFNLAAELERELSEEEEPPPSPDLNAPTEEVSLEEIFREFKKGVEQQLSPEDYDTHYNLGIAYKEMGLLDEAVGEFQIAAKDPARATECCSMLGLCFREKGMLPLAVEWFSRGLQNPELRPEERMGLNYDLADVKEQMGDGAGAHRIFTGIYGENANYRDVAARLRSFENSR